MTVLAVWKGVRLMMWGVILKIVEVCRSRIGRYVADQRIGSLGDVGRRSWGIRRLSYIPFCVVGLASLG